MALASRPSCHDVLDHWYVLWIPGIRASHRESVAPRREPSAVPLSIHPPSTLPERAARRNERASLLRGPSATPQTRNYSALARPHGMGQPPGVKQPAAREPGLSAPVPPRGTFRLHWRCSHADSEVGTSRRRLHASRSREFVFCFFVSCCVVTLQFVATQ